MMAELQYQRRLAKEEAEDIAYSVLVDICDKHALHPYANLAGAYFQAGRYRANKYFQEVGERTFALSRSWGLHVAAPIATDRLSLAQSLAMVLYRMV